MPVSLQWDLKMAHMLLHSPVVSWASGNLWKSGLVQVSISNYLPLIQVFKQILSTDGRCPPVPAIQNAMTSDWLTVEGSEASFSCTEGFRLPSGGKNFTLRCQQGDWQPWPISCDGKESRLLSMFVKYFVHNLCLLMPTVSSGWVSSFGYVQLLLCQPKRSHIWVISIHTVPRRSFPPQQSFLGSQLLRLWSMDSRGQDVWTWVSHQFLSILKDINWSVLSFLLNFFCLVAVDCGSPPIVLNAERAFSTTTYKSQVKYSCIKGKWFKRQEFSSSLTCNSSGLWDPLPGTCKGSPHPQTQFWFLDANCMTQLPITDSGMSSRCNLFACPHLGRAS